MKKRHNALFIFILASFVAVLFAQEGRRALSVADIEELLKAGVSQRRVAEFIEERGVGFDVTREGCRLRHHLHLRTVSVSFILAETPPSARVRTVPQYAFHGNDFHIFTSTVPKPVDTVSMVL